MGGPRLGGARRRAVERQVAEGDKHRVEGGQLGQALEQVVGQGEACGRSGDEVKKKHCNVVKQCNGRWVEGSQGGEVLGQVVGQGEACVRSVDEVKKNIATLSISATDAGLRAARERRRWSM